MGRKTKRSAVSPSPSSGIENMTSMIPYFGISSSFENLEDWIKDSTSTSSLHNASVSSPPHLDDLTQPQSNRPPLVLITPSPPPPVTPISSKRRNSVHNQQRKSRIIDLITAPSSTEKKNSEFPISPLSTSSHSTSSHFPLKSPPGLPPEKSSLHSRSNSSKSSQGSKRSIPPELECADYMDVPKVPSKITGGTADSSCPTFVS
jgi:hypothetical protein